jgi:hypothetical protein
LKSPFLGFHATVCAESYTMMKRFDMEASLAGRLLDTSGLAIQQQATMPAPTSITGQNRTRGVCLVRLISLNLLKMAPGQIPEPRGN